MLTCWIGNNFWTGYLVLNFYLSLIFEIFNSAMLVVKQFFLTAKLLVGNEFLMKLMKLESINNDSSRLILNLAAASSSPKYLKKI